MYVGDLKDNQLKNALNPQDKRAMTTFMIKEHVCNATFAQMYKIYKTTLKTTCRVQRL